MATGTAPDAFSADGGQPVAPFVEAAESLLERRRSQRGLPTFGDAQDQLLATRSGGVGEGAALEVVRHYGRLVGRHVLSRRFFEDTLRGAFIVASTTLVESGWGRLDVEELFHRDARVAFHPSPSLDAPPAPVVGAFMAGLLHGYLEESFNCVVEVTGDTLVFRVRLGEGRDVNARRSSR